MADCAGEEMEPSSGGAPFSRDSSWHIGVGTRWLLEDLPGMAELHSVLLCAWSPAVEVIFVADVSAGSALDNRGWRGESSHLGTWGQQMTGSQVSVHSDTRLRGQKEMTQLTSGR